MLNRKIGDGSWENTASTRKKPLANPVCLRDERGNLRSSADRADVMAKHLATKQFGTKSDWTYRTPTKLVGLKILEDMLVSYLLT